MKIRTKIFLLIFVSSLLIFSLVIFYILGVYRTSSLRTARDNVINYNLKAADLIQTSLEKDLRVCKTMSESFLGHDSLPLKMRDHIYQNTLKNVLAAHPEYISVWMSWELRYLNSKYTLGYGRRRTAAVMDLGLPKLYIDSADLHGDDLLGAYYQAKKDQKDVLSNPYFYQYAQDTQDSILEASIAVPMMVNEKFAGLVGIDLTLGRFWKLIKEIKTMSISEMYLLSNEGLIISSSEKDQDVLTDITQLYPDLNDAQTLQNIASGKRFEYSFIDSTDTRYFAAFAPITMGNASNKWSVCLILPQHFFKKGFKTSFYNLILISLVGILILSIISYYVANRITLSIRKASGVLKDLSEGHIDIPVVLQTRNKDELAEMNTAINKLTETLKTTATFAKRIGSGDFSATNKTVSKQDVLGNALLEMQANLKKGQEQEEIRQIERQKLSWTQEGLNELSELLRMSSDDFEEYLLSILRFIIKFFKAEQGAIFLLNTIDGEKPFLQLRTAYAYEKKKVLEANIEIGENLVGRCFKEKETIYMTNLPKGYAFVSSGLGGHQPKCLFLMPLIFEQKAMGVVEIASFKTFEDYEIDFLKEVGDRIASSISVMQKNLQTQSLLDQYKTKSIELENIESILEKNEKALRKSVENAQDYALENDLTTDLIANFASVTWLNLDAKVISVKDRYLTEKGNSQIDIIRQRQSAILLIREQETRKFKRIWSDIMGGETRTMESFYVANNKEVKVVELFTPIKNSSDKIVRILNITLDYGRIDAYMEQAKKS